METLADNACQGLVCPYLNPLEDRRHVNRNRIIEDTMRAILFAIFAIVVHGDVEASPLTSWPKLMSEYRQAGERELNVLVKFGDSKGLKSERQAQIKERQAGLIERYRIGQDQVLKRYKNLPMISMKLDVDELSVMMAENDVEFFVDQVHRPLLAESVPIVYPNQSTSIYHGDNRWAVAVIDSGVDKGHPMLSGKVIAEACFSTTDVSKSSTSLCPDGSDQDNLPDSSSIEVDSALPCSSTIPECAHGTQIAGVVAGNGTMSDGVARDAKIIAIQVYSRFDDELLCFPEVTCLGAYSSDVIAALDHVLSLDNSLDIAAVNLSLGFLSGAPPAGTCDGQPEKISIDALRSANIPVIASVGGDSLTQGMRTPACVSSAISVASTDNMDIPASDNNINAALDLFAPGEDIQAPIPGGSFAQGRGTSFAAAHVAGAWAAVKNKNSQITVDEVEALFKSTGVDVSQHGETRKRINLEQVLDLLPQQADDELCIPIKAKNGKVTLICL